MSKITTEECRKAIASYFAPKTVYQDLDPDLTNSRNWKRVSKRGNPEKGFIRVFRNTKVDGLINVHSTTDKITKVERNVVTSPEVKETRVVLDSNRTTVRDGRTLQEIFEDDEYGEGIFELPFADLPRININTPEDMEYAREMLEKEDLNEYGRENYTRDLEPDYELVNFENREIEEIGDNFIRITAGGDWQPATTWTSYIGADGRLFVDPSSIDYSDEWARPNDGRLIGTNRLDP